MFQEFACRMRAAIEKFSWLLAVAEDGKIVGYSYATPFKERSAYRYIDGGNMTIKILCN
jgi:L-amino acid N-acyltransferase YncA